MSWSLKKLAFGSGGQIKYNIDFQEHQGVCFLEKYDELSESVAFGEKLWYFTEQNGPKGGPHENEYQIQKSSKRKQVDEKSGVIPVVSVFSS